MLSKILKFLNGKKTAIGAALMLVGQFAPDAVSRVLPVIDTVATQGGAVIAAVGLAHKALKSLIKP